MINFAHLVWAIVVKILVGAGFLILGLVVLGFAVWFVLETYGHLVTFAQYVRRNPLHIAIILLCWFIGAKATGGAFELVLN